MIKVKKQKKIHTPGLYDVLIKPYNTEKTEKLVDKGVYTFEVNKLANKGDIKRAIETIFKVSVVKVAVMNCIGKKVTQFGRSLGTRNAWKKAVVRLKKGDKIDVL
jgi:large subunit ribosomal protein L23